MVTLQVSTITCAGCGESIKNALKSEFGKDIGVEVNIEKREVIVTGGEKVTFDSVKKVIEEAGHEATPCGEAGHSKCSAGESCTCGPVCNCGDNCTCSHCPGKATCTTKGAGVCAADSKCTCIDCQCGPNCDCTTCPGGKPSPSITVDFKTTLIGLGIAAFGFGYIVGSYQARTSS